MVLIFASTIDARRRRMRRGAYVQSCGSFGFDDGFLTAVCAPEGTLTQSVSTRLNLNTFIANVNGKLQINSSFKSTCRECNITPKGELSCECQSADGLSWPRSSVSLDEIISNINGSLKLDR